MAGPPCHIDSQVAGLQLGGGDLGTRMPHLPRNPLGVGTGRAQHHRLRGGGQAAVLEPLAGADETFCEPAPNCSARSSGALGYAVDPEAVAHPGVGGGDGLR
eukprot:5444145-Pyramimonas_sp.AAC.1